MYDPRQRFPKEYLDRLDLLSIDGPMLDAASWHVQRSIWNPRARLESRDIDVGPRDAHRYLGPGWSFGQSEPAGTSGEVTFSRQVTAKAVLFVSLPTGAVNVVLRASSSPGPAPAQLSVRVDGHQTSQMKLEGSSYRDMSFRIPPDAQRPSISEITLHLEGGSGDVPVFKLDRIVIQPQ
jgi:hypothetical protein